MLIWFIILSQELLTLATSSVMIFLTFVMRDPLHSAKNTASDRGEEEPSFRNILSHP